MFFLLVPILFESCIANNDSMTCSSNQLLCLGGSAGCNQKYKPSIVECFKQNNSHQNWICESKINSRYSLGKEVTINCESYDIEDCSLEYYLNTNSYNRPDLTGLIFMSILILLYCSCLRVPRNSDKSLYCGLAIGYSLGTFSRVSRGYYISRSVGNVIYN
jgi:hypothetical protein